MTQNQTRALQALMTQPNKKAAADAAGISERTLRSYFTDPEFVAAYHAACESMIEGATRKAQSLLFHALDTLDEICTNPEENGGARVSASRSILEYGLRLTEITDLVHTLEEAEEGDRRVL